MTRLQKHDTITRVENVAQRLFEERMLVITPKDSILHRFNQVGTFIWRLLETPKTVEEIFAAVKEHFEVVDDGQAYDEIAGFITKMKEKKLVTIQE